MTLPKEAREKLEESFLAAASTCCFVTCRGEKIGRLTWGAEMKVPDIQEKRRVAYDPRRRVGGIENRRAGGGGGEKNRRAGGGG